MKCVWTSRNNESICGVVKFHTCKCHSWGVGSWTDCGIVWVCCTANVNNAWKIWCQSTALKTFWSTIVRWSLCIYFNYQVCACFCVSDGQVEGVQFLVSLMFLLPDILMVFLSEIRDGLVYRSVLKMVQGFCHKIVSLSDLICKLGTRVVQNIHQSEMSGELNFCLYSLWPDAPSKPHCKSKCKKVSHSPVSPVQLLWLCPLVQ